ncbi:uncharacterized protein [Rutidosis leptorrhynchoides]|uniref:uncharacterized protein n=1 Tax=Rutidosis leptorrhynchoides TaxID=125765 RepID=UPI003A98CF8F
MLLLVLGLKPNIYKSLMNQHAQKIWKQLPVYQTLNEGSEHSPKFRCTVWVGGMSYTSPSTFQRRKMAEMDASRVALFGSLQNLKNEASRLVSEDKSMCKSILVEYAHRMNIQNPTYHTIQLDTRPVFRSSLVFDGVSCTGENCKSKKESERSAALDVILKVLDSDSGIIISEIIKRRYKHYAIFKKLQNAQNVTNEVVVPTGTENGVTLIKTKVEEGTKVSHLESCSDEDTTIHATHLFADSTQRPSQEVTTQSLTPAATVLQHTTFAGIHVLPSSNVVKVENVEAFSATIQEHTPAISETVVLPQTPSVGTHVLPSSSNVDKVENSEVLSVTTAIPTVAQATFVVPISGKKRNRRKQKIKAQKKMRAEDQLSTHAVPPS